MSLFYVLIALVIHELGHILVISKVGKISKIGINRKGFFCQWDPATEKRYLLALVAIAGPLANLIAAGIATNAEFAAINILFGMLNLVLPGGDGTSAVKRLQLPASSYSR